MLRTCLQNDITFTVSAPSRPGLDRLLTRFLYRQVPSRTNPDIKGRNLNRPNIKQ